MNGDSGIVNSDSGNDRKSVHVQPEQVFTMNRNRCSRSTRMSVHDQPDYALLPVVERRIGNAQLPTHLDHAGPSFGLAQGKGDLLLGKLGLFHDKILLSVK